VDFTGIATVATLKATTGIVTTLSVTGNATVGGTLDITGDTTLNGNLDLQDNDILRIGAGDDLQIYHDGSDSYIDEAGTGDLKIRSASGIQLQNGSEKYIACHPNGAVELYYDNDLHFATTSDGCKTNGDLSFRGDGDVEQILFDASDASLKFTDGKRAKFGDGADLHIYHDGSNSSIVDFGTGKLLISGNDAIFFQSTGTGDYFAKFNSDAAVELYYDNSKKFETKTDGVVVTGGIYLDGSGGTASANKLDDYEEGTFTPSWKTTSTNYSSVTYSNQSGSYTKIGNQVFVSLRLISSAYTGSPSGNLVVDGLPFTINDSKGSGGGSPSFFNIDVLDSAVNVAIEVRNGYDEVYLLASQDDGSWANVSASGIRSNATSEIRVSFFYTTNS
jgi:hypothetical protein